MTSDTSTPRVITDSARISIDPRGQRFAAAVTSGVLTLVLLTGSGVLLAAQAVVFAAAVGFGVGRGPYAMFFRHVLRPRLGPPGELEAAGPPRFAQGVGLAFAAVGALGYLSGAIAVGVVAASLALFAAFMNAAFGLCIGCEMYLAIRRVHTAISFPRRNHRKEASI